MNTHVHTFSRLSRPAFGSPFREQRECGRVDANPPPAPASSSPLGPDVRQYRLDPRSTLEHQDATLQFLRGHLIPHRRSWFMRLFGGDSPARIDKEGRMQSAERDTDRGIFQQDAEMRNVLLGTHPEEFKRGMHRELYGRHIDFHAAGMNAAGVAVPNFDVRVDLRNPFWQAPVVRSVEQIAERIEHCPNRAALTAIGISGHFATHDLDHCTKDQAKEIAKFISVRYTRPNLAMGMVSEVNVRMAQKMLLDTPDLIDTIQNGAHHDDDEKKIRAKQQLAELVHTRLGKITGETFTENFAGADTEFTHLAHDIDNYLDPTFSAHSDFFKKTLKLNDAARVQAFLTGAAPRPEVLDAKIERAGGERTRLKSVCDYYRNLNDTLEALHAQLRTTEGFAPPTSGPFADIFVGGPAIGRTNRANLSRDTNPVNIQRDLLNRMEIKKPDEYAKDLEHAKAHAKEAKDNKIVGARSVIETYKEHFKRTEDLSDDEARTRAFQTFFKNEVSLIENRQMEEEIEKLFGKTRLTRTRGVINGALSAGKGLLTGSDEDYICRIFEQVGVKSGAGTAATTWRGKALEGGTWIGTGAATGALLSATGLVASSFPPALLVAGLGAAGYGIFKGLSLAARWWPNAFWNNINIERNLFGTRQLGYGWRRWGARPEIGRIAHDRLALRWVWDAMRTGIKEGKLSNTWYARDIMNEVGRLLVMTLAEEMGEDVGAQTKLDPAAWKFFSMDNKRAKLQKQIRDLVGKGAAWSGDRERPEIAEGAKHIEKEAADNRGRWRRGVGNFFFGGGFDSWLNKKG